MAQLAGNEGRSRTAVDLWALLSTMPNVLSEPAYGAFRLCSPTLSFALGLFDSYQPIEDAPTQLHPDLRETL
ncbi:hypothetical protein BKA70DRAFT_1424688 [Coprinopsis sp. MPI-PUGE-AT-0042]|nr:hypothetical protein BKA70DRAFT_1424688 [Coprinopsis sp. MPI-PUGE-AT-0042]